MAQYRAITEGFDLYSGWDASSGTGAASVWANMGAASVQIGAGRFGGQSLRVSGATGTTASSVRRAIPPSSMVAMGSAVRLPSMLQARTIFTLAGGAGPQLSLSQNANGSLSIASGATTLATSPIEMLPAGQWSYIELCCGISSTTGSVQVFIDGVEVESLTLSNVDTQGQSTSEVEFIQLWGVGITAQSWYDDFYVEVDGTTRIGEGRMWTGQVVSDVTKAFTPLTGTSNYAMVDEVPVSAADYNYSDVFGARDTFQVADLDFEPAEIYGLQITMNATKDEAGARAVKNVLVSGATEQLGSQFVLALSANNWHNDFWALNPDTGAPWTISDINAINIGYEITL